MPPQAAFNDRPVSLIDDPFAIGPDDVGRRLGPIQQRGAGAYTLCATCNNTTGSWYAGPFVEWCRLGMAHLRASGGRPSLILVHDLQPLAVLKQIVTMFFSSNGLGIQAKNPGLVRFVLNREERGLPPDIRFFVYYARGPHIRNTGVMASLDLNRGTHTLLSEISFPPFGYVMTYGDDAPDPRLVEITHFANRPYGEATLSELPLSVLETHTLVPGDYRPREQVLREAGRAPDE